MSSFALVWLAGDEAAPASPRLDFEATHLAVDDQADNAGGGDIVAEAPGPPLADATIVAPGWGDPSAGALALRPASGATPAPWRAEVKLPLSAAAPGTEADAVMEVCLRSDWHQGRAGLPRVMLHDPDPARDSPDLSRALTLGFVRHGRDSPYVRVMVDVVTPDQPRPTRHRSPAMFRIETWYELRLVVRADRRDATRLAGDVFARNHGEGETAWWAVPGLDGLPLGERSSLNPPSLRRWAVWTEEGDSQIDNLYWGQEAAPWSISHPAGRIGSVADAPVRRQGRALVVNQNHAAADDRNPGTPEEPFRSINAAARQAGPGDEVVVHAGVYREWVQPGHSGTREQPVIYRAADGQTVVVRGSDPWSPRWRPVSGHREVRYAGLRPELFEPLHLMPAERERSDAGRGRFVTPGAAWRDVYNPFVIRARASRGSEPLGQVFHRGVPLDKIFAKPPTPYDEAMPDVTGEPVDRARAALLGYDDAYRAQVFELSLAEVARTPGSWTTNPHGDKLFVHFPDGVTTGERETVEISTHYHVFAPLRRGRVDHLHVSGFTFEHAANQPAFPQEGMVSTRNGRGWRIENNTIRYANAVGLDCGQVHYVESWVRHNAGEDRQNRAAGHHVIRGNTITDNGQLGLGGYNAADTLVLNNVVERNGLAIPGAETAGIKFHGSGYSVFEGNLVRGNGARGLWIDAAVHNTRITRNLVCQNRGLGVFVELTFGPVFVDHNVIALNTGDGFYTHDASGVVLAHNLLYENAGYGAQMILLTDRTTRHPETPRHIKTQVRSSEHAVLNNLFVRNAGPAIALPQPSGRAQGSRSDHNAFIVGDSRLVFEYSTKNGTRAGKDAARLIATGTLREDETLPTEEDRRGPRLSLEAWQRVAGFDTASRMNHADIDLDAERLSLSIRGTPPAGVEEIDHELRSRLFQSDAPKEITSNVGPFLWPNTEPLEIGLWPIMTDPVPAPWSEQDNHAASPAERG